MALFSKLMKGIDLFIEWIGAIFMAAMVVIVFYAVFARYLFHHVPSWSDEVTLLLMMWFGFLSIGYGFRKQVHLRITMFTEKLPRRINTIFDILTDILIAAFGLFLIKEGISFTKLTWLSTLPVTKLPSGVQYMIIPVTGLLTMIYGIVLLINRKGKQT